MEDEAEVELLEQHLLKTRQISKKMSSILAKFDNRLIKLEKSVQPMHEATVLHTRRINNIDATIASLQKMASVNEGLAMEENLIMRGPRPEDLRVYTDTVERLNANIALGSGGNVADLARLVENATKKLTLLYTKLVAEGSSGQPPLKLTSPTSLFPTQTLTKETPAAAPFPPDTLNVLNPIVVALRRLPLPSTHPSHPASKEIERTLKDTQRGYADMRGVWAKKCLEGGGRRVIERLESSVSIQDSVAEVSEWSRMVVGVCDTEYNHLQNLAPLPSGASISQTYSYLLKPILTLTSNTMNGILAFIKKDLSRYTFLALSLFSSLPNITEEWDRAITARVDGPVGAEMKEALSALRSICLRSFPELLVDVQTAALPGTAGGEIGTSVAPIVKTVVGYLTSLPSVLPAVVASLSALGDGNWRMGQGMTKAPGVNPRNSGNDDLVGSYIFDLVQATLTAFTALSKQHKRPALGSIFLINNISHLRGFLLDPPAPSSAQATTIDELLTKPTRDLLNSSFRTSKAEYFSANYTPLINCLSDDPPSTSTIGDFGFGGGAKAKEKDKLKRFWEVLDELYDRHRVARVLDTEGDEEGRELLGDEAVRLVVPQLERFVDRGTSKNPSKYMKMTPDEVERKIREMYS